MTTEERLRLEELLARLPVEDLRLIQMMKEEYAKNKIEMLQNYAEMADEEVARLKEKLGKE